MFRARLTSAKPYLAPTRSRSAPTACDFSSVAASRRRRFQSAHARTDNTVALSPRPPMSGIASPLEGSEWTLSWRAFAAP